MMTAKKKGICRICTLLDPEHKAVPHDKKWLHADTSTPAKKEKK